MLLLQLKFDCITYYIHSQKTKYVLNQVYNTMPFFILGYIAYLNISIGYQKNSFVCKPRDAFNGKKIINISNYLDKIQNHIMTSKLHV